MEQDTFPMTETGLYKLQHELEQLETVERTNIEERISTLRYKIHRAAVIKKTGKTQVELGSTISFKDISSGKIETYTIVGTEEADPFEGTISSNSPIAKSLLGAKVNDIVTVETPNGKWQFEIVNIS